MRRLDSNEIKAVELNILKELDRVCRENHLTYFLAYGSALGARRHGGFIPWDDDIDVCVPRDDYERLYELCVGSGALTGPYRLVSYRDRSSVYQFLKLVDTSTTSFETFVGRSRPIGLWVDIFPLEPVGGVSEERLSRALRRQRATDLRRNLMLADPTVGKTRLVRAVKRVVGGALSHGDPYRASRQLDEGARAIGCGDDSLWYDVLGLCGPYDAATLFPTRELRFEDATFPVPADIDRYLAQQYGNWEQVPPEDQRDTHFPEAYALGD